MKITIDSKSFASAVSWTTKNYDSKNTNSYVALKLNKNGQGHLFHLSQTSFMKCNFDVIQSDTDESEFNKNDEVEFALEGIYLQKLASAISSNGDSIILTSKDLASSKSLEAKTKTGRFTIPLLSTNISTEPKLISLGEVDDREFFDSVQRLSKLCDPQNAGYIPVLATVDIKLIPDEDKIVMMATDRYALGEITIPFTPESNTVSFVEQTPNILLPVEDAVLIPPSKGITSSTTITYEEKGGKFGYVFSDGRIALFSLKDAEPLPYQRLKEKASKAVVNEFDVDSALLKTAIQSVSSLAWEENEIFFEISEDGLKISDSRDTNKITVEIENVVTDQTYAVKFVRSIINEAFSPISTGKIKVKWANEKSPFVLYPVLDNGEVSENTFVFVVPCN